MADSLTVLHDLSRRVLALERNAATQTPRGRSPQRTANDSDSVAILRYLRDSSAREAEDRDVAAVRAWLVTTSRPNRRPQHPWRSS